MELLEQFTHGDIDAFEKLFRQFQKDVYAWIIRIVRDPGVAEDLTIETFWRVYRSRARFDTSRSFGAWTRRIATNVALDHLKHAPTEIELPENLPHETVDPAIEHDRREQIRKAFYQLAPKLRLTATLALVEERPYSEIAEALGVPIGTVKSRVFKAIRILRKKLQRLGIEP